MLYEVITKHIARCKTQSRRYIFDAIEQLVHSIIRFSGKSPCVGKSERKAVNIHINPLQLIQAIVKIG